MEICSLSLWSLSKGNKNLTGCFTVLLGLEKSCFHSPFRLSFAMEPGLVAREISGKGSNHAEEQQCQSRLRYTWIHSGRWMVPTHKKKVFWFPHVFSFRSICNQNEHFRNISKTMCWTLLPSWQPSPQGNGRRGGSPVASCVHPGPQYPLLKSKAVIWCLSTAIWLGFLYGTVL